MLTLERYYSNQSEFEITAGANKNEWHLAFVDEHLNIQITVRNRTDFEALLKHIQDIGQTMLDATDAKPDQ